jgi:excisionase family DNA binding protein
MDSSATITPRLIRPKEASAYIAVSERTLWKLTQTRAIPAVRLGRAVRYDVVDLDRFIEKNKSQGN